jgi:hypothetical protein
MCKPEQIFPKAPTLTERRYKRFMRSGNGHDPKGSTALLWWSRKACAFLVYGKNTTEPLLWIAPLVQEVWESSV